MHTYSVFSWKNLPYLLLVAYVALICFNFFSLSHRVAFLFEHPVHVLEYTRDFKTRLDEMQHTLPGLLATPDLDYNDIATVLERQERMQAYALNRVKELFMENPELVDRLEQAFAAVRSKRSEAASLLIGNTDFNKSLHIYNTKVAPYIHILNDDIDAIANSARHVINTNQEKIDRSSLISVILTIIFGILIALAFYFVNKRDKLQSRELQDRDRLFNQLSKNVDEIFIMAIKADSFKYVTTNTARLIGIPWRDILADPEVFYNFLPEEDAKWLKNALSTPDNDSSQEEHLVMFDNGQRVMRLSIYPFRDGDEHRTIIALQDRTNEHRQQQTLRDALESANAASVAKSSFLSHMSHEIRTPMNAIIGMTTIALSRIGEVERVQDCLLKIADASRHLLNLINDVLDMSKIENGKLSINNEPFNLAAIVRNINDLVRPQAEAKGLNFEILHENVEEERLVGDALRLNQILINILSNALKFTPRDGSIILKIRQTARNMQTLHMSFVISDTGIGMSQEFLTRIFVPFEQETGAIAAKYGGTGLGMSITFNLVSLMGGSIQVDSREGTGTTFTVDLPFAYVQGGPARSRELPHLRVLVVDDDIGTCEHASLLLDKMGLDTAYCTSGREAIEMVKEATTSGKPFDVCFIDWKMPEMDGAETAAHLRKIAGADLLVIIISAYDWTPIEEKARQAGVTGFVAKPFFASTLYDALISNTLPTRQEPEPPRENYDFTGKRVLLAEDNEFNREIAQEFLEMVNIDVKNAANGKQALEMFEASEPGYYDLILMDVQMPQMDGYEATKAIRTSSHANASTVPILAMTANAFSEDVAQALASGMNAHIAKPIDVKELYSQLDTWFNKK